MECFACSSVCPTDAIEIDKIYSCMRLIEERRPVRINEEKCIDCNKCDETCPMCDIALSAKSCSFCIVCKNMPNCILPADGRVSLLNSISSIARFMILMPRFIFQ